jgi:hypothetical protein
MTPEQFVVNRETLEFSERRAGFGGGYHGLNKIVGGIAGT